jgi:hypothetical protein
MKILHVDKSRCGRTALVDEHLRDWRRGIDLDMLEVAVRDEMERKV